MKTGFLRIGRYTLSNRDGYFQVIGKRYANTDQLFLNITHHCVPVTKRKKYRYCFTTTKHKIHGDTKNVRYEIEEIALEHQIYQESVHCRDWPYEYPQFVKDYIKRESEMKTDSDEL
ncbi:unnamed protein product [Thelazia callipaeda]|uniref:Phage protein n=1 Tax=Thelazia callipaeda TaxID=103827 RepID=A0A0N5CNA9_THECL|nr:unnamed protein product [Thelazia callipaeda]